MEEWTLVDSADDVEDRDEGVVKVGTWLAERGISLDDIDPNDVRIDLMRYTSGTCRHRFWVRTDTLSDGA